MYRIKNDKRQIDSAMCLLRALTECLQNQKMTEISVSTLCAEANVSRSTFYRMFDTPLDLLEYTCDTYVEKAIADYPESVFKRRDDFVLYSLMYWNNNIHLLEAAVNCGRFDIIRKSFEAHSEKLVPMLASEFTELELAYVSVGFAGLIASLLTLWIKRGRKETPAQLFELYKKIIAIPASEFILAPR